MSGEPIPAILFWYQDPGDDTDKGMWHLHIDVPGDARTVAKKSKSPGALVGWANDWAFGRGVHVDLNVATCLGAKP